MAELRSLLKSATQLARQGHYESALDEFEMLLTHNPFNCDALYGAAACCYRLKKEEQALEYLTKLLKVAPHHHAGEKLRGRLQGSVLDRASTPLVDEVFYHSPVAPKPDLWGTGQGDSVQTPRGIGESQADKWATYQNAASVNYGRLDWGEVLYQANGFYSKHTRAVYWLGWVGVLFVIGSLSVPGSSLAFSTKLIGQSFLFGNLFSCVLITLAITLVMTFCGSSVGAAMTCLVRESVQISYLVKFFRVAVIAGCCHLVIWLPTITTLCFYLLFNFRNVSNPIAHAVVLGVVGLVQAYLVVRGWLINPVVVATEGTPGECLALAFAGSQQQFSNMLVLALSQVLLVLPCLLLLGWGIPLLSFSQGIAFRMVYPHLFESFRQTN